MDFRLPPEADAIEEQDFVPPLYRKASLVHCRSVYRTNEFGHLLVQQIEAGDYGYSKSIFSLKHDMIFKGHEKTSAARLLYVQEGGHSLALTGSGRLRLSAGQYLPLFISSRIVPNVLIPKGKHIISQIRVPPELLRYLALHDPAYQQIVSSLDRPKAAAIALPRRRTTDAIQKSLAEFGDCPAREPARRLFLQAKTCMMLAYYYPVSDPPAISTYTKERMTQVEAHIMSNLQAHHTVRGLARKFSIGERHLGRRFRQVYRLPIHQFILAKRMEKAMQLVEEDRMTILEISLDVGYNDLSSFHKAFLKHFGSPPGYYRKNKRRGSEK